MERQPSNGRLNEYGNEVPDMPKKQGDFTRMRSREIEKFDLDALQAEKKRIESLGPQFMREQITGESSDCRLSGISLELFMEYAQFIKTRERIVETSNSTAETGNGLCHEDARLNALEYGMPFYSGFAYNVVTQKTMWHCFNTDPQGYVVDTYVNGNNTMLSSVYYGVEIDPYLAGLSFAMEKETDMEEAEKFLDLLIEHLKTSMEEKRNGKLGSFARQNPKINDILEKKPTMLRLALWLAFMYKSAVNYKELYLRKNSISEEDYELMLKLGFLVALKK